MRRMLCLASMIAIFTLAASGALASDGDPDPGFGNGGQLTIERPPGAITSSTPTGDVAALPDGRFLWILANEDASIWIGRAAYDGSADPTFGEDHSGRVTLTDCTGFSTTRLVDDVDGGAVVWSGRCLLRLAPYGSVVAGFGATPLPTTNFLAAGFARDSAGRYVLAGTDNQEWLVFRFTAEGALDPSFGDDGEVSVPIAATNNLRGIEALAIRTDDRIVLGGWRGNTHGPNLVVAQLTVDGAPDPAWNGNGIVDVDAPSGQEGLTATALLLDHDGSLIVGGYAYGGGVDCCLLLARFDEAGALVTDFGLRTFPVSGVMSTFFEKRDSLAPLPGGGILFATTAFPASGVAGNHRTQFILVSADANGVLDPTFGEGGWRGYTIADPTGSGQSGDYDQLHAMVYAQGSALMFGRTFFEDASNGFDYISMVRANFDALFANGFE